MKSIILFTLITVFFTCNPLCQSSLTGTIKTEDNVPVNTATIVLTNASSNQKTISDNQGNFIFSNLSAGNYNIKVERAGFLEFEKELEIRENEQKKIDIILILDVFLFEEVSIVSESMGLTDKTPYNIHTLDAREITLKGSPSGVMGLIQNEPGVNAAEMGHGIVKPFIRGLGFSRVATIYQGGKLENHQWGADHGLGLNDLGISSVDIIKGPASLLYGSGALGGVLIMNDAEHYLHSGHLSGNLGTTINTVSSGVRTYGSIGKKWKNGFYLATDLAYENHADYFDGNNRLIGNSRFNSSTMRFHSGFQSSNYKGKLSYSYNHQLLGIIEDDEMDDDESLTTFRSDRVMQLPFQDVTDQLLSYRQELRFSDNWNTQMDVVYHYNKRKEIEDAFDEIDLGLDQHHLFYNLRAMHQASDKFSGTYGVQGSVLSMKNLPDAEEILIPNASYYEQALYALGTFKPSENHTFQGGLRFDYRNMNADANQENIIEEGYVLPGEPENRMLDLDFLGITGSMGYTYRHNKYNMLKFNLSSGFRSPDIAELLSNGPHPGTNRFEVGNIDFRREQSLQADATWLKNTKHVSIALSAFGNYVNNYIFFVDSGDTTSSGLNIWEFRQTDAFLYGGEIEFTFKPKGNDRFQIATHANIIRGLDLTSDDNLTFVPADRIGIAPSFRPIKEKPLNIKLGYDYVFQQNRPGIGENSTSGYHLVNAQIQYAFEFNTKKLEIGLSGFNLLNQVYFDHISILRAFEITSPGVNAMLNVRFSF